MRCLHHSARIALMAILGLGLSSFAATAQQAQRLNPDQLEAAVADRTPGFAGYVHHEDGRVVARMVENGSGYNARELLTYKERAISTASLNGVIAASINRESNRVEVAYNAALNAQEVRAVAARLEAAGVPMAAVTLRPSEPMKFRAQVGQSIQTQTPPLAGGSQIVSGGTSSNETECSMGVPAIRDGVVGFVTASHCSASVFSFVPNNTFFAPTLQSPLLGNEAVDPAGTNCLAQANRGCRESDAMFVAAASDELMDFGKILRTDSLLNVTRTINVVGTTDYPAVGRVVHKTGRTTGTRAGRIARTCVDTLLSDGVEGNYLVQCATEVDNPMFSSPGDSGAAIWISVAGGAKVAGILSYGNGSTTGFSPWGSVVKDLGPLTVR